MIFIFSLIVIFIFVLTVVKFFGFKQSSVYLVLWLLSAINLLGNSGFLKLFGSLFPEAEFGTIGKGFSTFFFVFACITVVHQGFLYYYLHDLEENEDKWEKLYPGFYNSIWEKSIRTFAFLLLLISVDKIPFLKSYIYTNYSAPNCTDKQTITLIGSSILFMTLVIYNIVSGIWCKKLRDRNHLFHTSGDLIAFIFWGLITWKVLISKEQTIGNWVFLPLSIGVIYISFFLIRIYNSIKENKVI